MLFKLIWFSKCFILLESDFTLDTEVFESSFKADSVLGRNFLIFLSMYLGQAYLLLKCRLRMSRFECPW